MNKDETDRTFIRTVTLLSITLIFIVSICSAQTTQPASQPKSTPSWSELLKIGWAQFDTNDFDSALTTVNQVIALKPDSGNAALLHFLILNRKDPDGDLSEAATRVIELVLDKNWLEMAYLYRGSIRLRNGDYARALDDCNSALVMNPSSALGYHLRSFTYLMKGDFANTRADYERSVQLDPQSPSPFVVRAYWLCRKGAFTQALADYETAIEWKPNYAEAYANRGIVFGLSGKIDFALEDLRKARELKPDVVSDNPYNGVGRSPFWDLNSFVITHPQNARGYEMRGILRTIQQKRSEAEQDFIKSLELDPSLRPEIEKAARFFN